MDGTPEITVIVPVYNVQDHVAACIHSLRDQTWADFEAVIVDDGSTDDSSARLIRAIDDDPRFRIVRQDNQGLSGARNTGLDMARGRFIAFLDSDDRYAPGFLFRLREELLRSGADWAACAIRLQRPDGSSNVHSAIQGTTGIEGLPRTQLWVFDDWRTVIRHFPSAWNKLYRRELIADLRYDVGTYFEDHAFYYRAAARTGTLMHVAEPLYIHSRDRPGQITGEDTDRVFEQIGVLETVSGLITEAEKSSAREAFERLSSRLLYERAVSIRDRDRRRRFARAGAAFLDRHGLAWNDRWDQNLSPVWGAEMAGRCPLSVVVAWDGQRRTLNDTLASLARQDLPVFETLIAVSSRRQGRVAQVLARDAGLEDVRTVVAARGGVATHRNAGLDAAAGDFLVPLNAGDTLETGTLLRWSETMFRQSADMGISGAYHLVAQRQISGMGGKTAGFRDFPRHSAWQLSGRQVLELDVHPTGKVFRTAFLRGNNLRFGGDRNDERSLIRLAARASAASVWMPEVWVRVLDESGLRAAISRVVPPGSALRRYSVAALRRSWMVAARLRVVNRQG